ncbi:hypothetical protein J6590_094245, partial [Homalodisca vitripennis]
MMTDHLKQVLCQRLRLGLGLPVLKSVAVHSPLLLHSTAMAAMTLLCAPRLEYYMVLGPVLRQ